MNYDTRKVTGWRSRLQAAEDELERRMWDAPSRTVYREGATTPNPIGPQVGHTAWFHLTYGPDRAAAREALAKLRADQRRIERAEEIDDQREARRAKNKQRTARRPPVARARREDLCQDKREMLREYDRARRANETDEKRQARQAVDRERSASRTPEQRQRQAAAARARAANLSPARRERLRQQKREQDQRRAERRRMQRATSSDNVDCNSPSAIEHRCREPRTTYGPRASLRTPGQIERDKIVARQRVEGYSEERKALEREKRRQRKNASRERYNANDRRTAAQRQPTTNARKRAAYASNPERFREKERAARAANVEKRRAQARARYARNRERLQADGITDARNERARLARELDHEQRLARERAYRAANRERLLAQARARYAKRNANSTGER